MPIHHYDPETSLADLTEVELLTEYLGGTMTEEEEQAFEDRLAEDEALFARVKPMLRRCYRNGPLPMEIELGKRLARRGLIEEPSVEPRRTRRRRRRRLTGKRSGGRQ